MIEGSNPHLDAKGQPDMEKIKAWNVGEKGVPFFPDDFEIPNKGDLLWRVELR